MVPTYGAGRGTEYTEGLFFDLSHKLPGQIKILSPATRDRITRKHMTDITKLTGDVIAGGVAGHKHILNWTCPKGCAFCLIPQKAGSDKKE